MGASDGALAVGPCCRPHMCLAAALHCMDWGTHTLRTSKLRAGISEVAQWLPNIFVLAARTEPWRRRRRQRQRRRRRRHGSETLLRAATYIPDRPAQSVSALRRKKAMCGAVVQIDPEAQRKARARDERVPLGALHSTPKGIAAFASFA
jgi:hypothetical protein